MKEEPNIDETIHKIEQMLEDKRRIMHYVHAGTLMDILALLKEQEARELTIDEWREWKANPKRDPICKLWENDTSPMWILKPEDVHEPALLIGKIKLFTRKPTYEQCKDVKWKDE